MSLEPESLGGVDELSESTGRSSAAAMPVARFLSGQARDAAGRTIEDVLAFSDTDLESRHDYIQWLFPLPTRSGAFPGAPIVNKAEQAVIRGDARALANVRSAVVRMRSFYARNDHWLTSYDHNHLRITRIITSLGLLFGPADAIAFHDWIEDRVGRAGNPVNAVSRQYWREARTLAEQARP